MTEMLGVLDHFVEWSQMEVNVKKCAIASHMLDENKHRSSLATNFVFKVQEISFKKSRD
jgi:hypothetical protein